MKNKKKFAVASLVCSLLSLVTLVIGPDSLDGAMIFVVVGIILGFVGVVLGLIGKSASKGLSVGGIVVGICSCVFLFFALIGFAAIKEATDCVDNGDETATCVYLGEELEVPSSMLTEDQMRK